MGKLNRYVDITKERALDFNKMSASKAYEGKIGSLKEAHMVSIKAICDRYMNEYIIDAKRTKSLCDSIRKNGLLQPILLMDINDYLTNGKNVSEEERKYLEEKKDNYQYFIVAGHRRFRAFASLFADKVLESKDDMDWFYREIHDSNSEFSKRFKVTSLKQVKEETDSGSNQYSKILAIVVNSNDLDETTAYNDSNITTRVPTQFEIIASVYKQLKKENRLDELENYRTSERDGVTVKLKKYIDDRYGIDVDKSNVGKTIKIVDEMDDRLVDYIYDGKMSVRDAYAISNFYEKIKNDQNIDRLIDEIGNDKFDIKKWKSEYGKTTHKENSKNNVLLKELKKIYSEKGNISLSELIDMLSK